MTGTGITLQARTIGVRLGAADVLADVSLDIEPGWTAIVGPNGAGKSTLLKALAGLAPLSRGQVLLDGRPLATWRGTERARRVAWLDQHGQASGDMSARDMVALGRLPHTGLFGQPGPQDEVAINEAMTATDCQPLADRKVSQLSGGERQRVLLARVLAVGAPVLLLDEPTTYLDPPVQARLVRLLAALAARCRVVTVLHDLTLALAADRLVVMDKGRIHAIGDSDDPRLHQSLSEVFDSAIRVISVDGQRLAVTQLANRPSLPPG